MGMTVTERPTRVDSMFNQHAKWLKVTRGIPWRRPIANHRNIHVRGYKEEGTTTTPFDMVMLNDMDRFHLVIDVIDRVPRLGPRAAYLRQRMVDERLYHREHTREHGDDPEDVKSWVWPR
jgi:phosphoketolase